MSTSCPVVPSLSKAKATASLGIILIGANLRAPITCVGPLLPQLQQAVHFDDRTAGLLNALPLLIFAILSLVAPALGRRHGVERTLALALGGIVLGTLLRSAAFASAIWIGTGLLSAGIALGNVLLPGLVKREFPTKATSLIAYYAAAMAGMAGVAAGLAVPVAQSHGFDWRISMALWSIPAMIALLVWLPQLRVSQHHIHSPSALSMGHSSPWKHPLGWQVSLFFALHSMVFYALVDWFPSYAAASGISATKAGWYLLIYQVVAIVTNLSCGPLIKKWNDQKALGLACGLLLLGGTTGLLLWPALSLFWLIVAGLGAGIAMVTSLSLFALRTKDHHQAAALSGMAQFVGYTGAAAGPFLFGTLKDLSKAWSSSLLLLMIASALFVVFAFLAGRRRIIA